MKRGRSYLEESFKLILKSEQARGIPLPLEEFQFAPPRKWRFDFAFFPKVAVELEGGIFIQGGHSRGVGHIRDMDKFNEAAAQGWRVLRFTNQHLRDPQTVLVLLKRTLGLE